MYCVWPDPPARPSVSLPEKAVVTDGEEKTIQCDITGFYPEKLAVTWHIQNGSHTVHGGVSHLSRVCTEMAVHNPDGTFSIRSGITLHSSAVKDGEIRIICQVDHHTYNWPYNRSVRLTVEGGISFFLHSFFKLWIQIIIHTDLSTYCICYMDLTNPFSLQLHHSPFTVQALW